MPDRAEDRRLKWVWLGVLLFGMVVSALRLPRFHSLVSGPLAYALALVAGVIAAALEASTLKRQLAYSIPFILVAVGEIYMVQWMDQNTHVVPGNKQIYAQALVGGLPGMLLYALVRWRLK